MSFELTQWAYAQKTATQTEKSVLVFLSFHAQPDGYSWHSNKSIATAITVTDRSVNNAINSLAHAGLITVNKRIRPTGSHTSNLIRVNPGRPLLPEDSVCVLERIDPSVICDFDGVPSVGFNVEPKYRDKFPTVRVWK